MAPRTTLASPAAEQEKRTAFAGRKSVGSPSIDYDGAKQKELARSSAFNNRRKEQSMPAPPKQPADSREANTWLQVDNSAKTTPPPSTPNFDSVNASAAGVGARNMEQPEYSSLFQKPNLSASGSDMTPRQPLTYNGAFAKGGDYGPGGRLAPGTPGGKVMADPNFSGVPTMYPAQQSVGQDIFGDTADLLRRRDTLQTEMDRHFAKNPLGNDLMANFHTIASQSGRRREIKELGDRLGKRDEIMAQLTGIMMSGQNQIATQQVQNQGQLQNTGLAGQIQLQNTGLQTQGNLAVQGMAGQQRLQQIGAEVEGNKQIVGLQGANQMATTQMSETGATERNKATIAGQVDAARAKPYDYPKNATEELKSIHGILYGADAANLSPEDKQALVKRMDYLRRLSTGEGLTPQ